MKKTNIICNLLLVIGLSFSSQVMAQTTPINCSDPTKESSKDSTCMNGLGLSGQSAPSNPSSNPIRPFAQLGKSCTTPWGQIINDGSSIMAFASSTGSYNYSTGEYASDCTDEIRRCTNGVLSGSYQHKACTMTPVDATCGPAHGSYYTYPTSGPSFADKCNPTYTYNGIAPNDDDSPPSHYAGTSTYLTNNMYSWSCSGDVGGASTSCYAYRRINAACNTSTINQCSLGTYVSGSSVPVYNPYTCNCVTTTNPTTGVTSTSCSTCYTYLHTVYNWSCNGINGGANTACSKTQ